MITITRIAIAAPPFVLSAGGTPKFPETGLFARDGMAGKFFGNGPLGIFARDSVTGIVEGIDLSGLFGRSGFTGLFE